MIVTAVHFPVPGEREWRHVAVAGAGGAVAAVAEEAAAIGSLGTATTVAIVAAVVGEVFESYVAASVRTRQYIAAGRSPDPAIIVTDLAEAAGFGESAGRRASARVAHDAAVVARREARDPHRRRGSAGRSSRWSGSAPGPASRPSACCG